MEFKVSNFRIRTPRIRVAAAFIESIEVIAGDIIPAATKNYRISIGVVSQIGFSESIRVGAGLPDEINYFTIVILNPKWFILNFAYELGREGHV